MIGALIVAVVCVSVIFSCSLAIILLLVKWFIIEKRSKDNE